MLKEFNLINLNHLKELNILIKKINKSKYKKIFFFPSNVYSNHISKKILKKKNFYH